MRRFLSVSAALIALAGCATPRPVPIAAPAPPPVPAPAAAPAPLAADWRDWPLTPGDWRYAPAAGGSAATFGAGAFGIACDRATRRVSLMPGLGASMTVRTTSLTRTVALQAAGDPASRAVGVLSSNDPLLDAMAFSRGSFVVEQAGQAPLVIPAYAEIGRVIEDCRG